MATEPARRLESTESIGNALSVHPETIRRQHRAGKIPGYYVGRVLRFDRDEVIAALRDDQPQSTRIVAEPDFDAIEIRSSERDDAGSKAGASQITQETSPASPDEKDRHGGE